MQYSVTGHHVNVSNALRDYVGQKLGRLERHFDQLTDIHCILTVEKLRHKAEATVHLSGGKLHASAVQDDMYAAIDSLIDKLDRQVIKHKEKFTARRHDDTGKQTAAE
jgi:putative sigma-54 modulation protein